MPRRCWTCNGEHEVDAPCGANPAVRAQRSQGQPGNTIYDRTADLFDDAPDERLGKIITAVYDGEDACCGMGIEDGDRIRADGQGGWIHANGECDK
jgi:hypothetical protein